MSKSSSAEKRARQSEKRQLRNRSVKSALNTTIRRYEAFLGEGNLEAAQVKLQEVASRLDKAAAKGVIHKNAASRKKSRLATKLNKASSQVASS